MTADRFHTPLYNLSEAARYLGVGVSTFSSWAKGYTHRFEGRHDVHGDPILTVIAGQRRGDASVPFVGLAEGLVLAGIRKSGVPMQRIRPALERLGDEFGLEHVLASKRLYADGAEVLWDFGNTTGDTDAAEVARQLVVIRNGQHVFTEIVQDYLTRIDFDTDGFAGVIRLPGYESAEVFVDPRRGFGQPTFRRGGARVEDALGMFWAGESLSVVSAEFGVPESQLEDAVRVASRQLAA